MQRISASNHSPAYQPSINAQKNLQKHLTFGIRKTASFLRNQPFWSECRDSLHSDSLWESESWCCRRPAVGKQLSTGQLFYIVRISKNENRKSKSSFGFHGPSVEIRTRGLLNPIQARYQTSPHPDIFCRSLGDFDMIPQKFKKSKHFFYFFSKNYTTLRKCCILPFFLYFP